MNDQNAPHLNRISAYFIGKHDLHPHWRVYKTDATIPGKVKITGGLAYPVPEGHPTLKKGTPVWESPVQLRRTFTISVTEYEKI